MEMILSDRGRYHGLRRERRRKVGTFPAWIHGCFLRTMPELDNINRVKDAFDYE